MNKPRPPGSKKQTPTLEFVALWNASPSAEEVARVVDRTVDAVRHRATDLRKKGHDLKSMRKDFDVEALARLAHQAKSLDHGYFVLVWQNARSLNEVMRFTGMDFNGVRQKAKLMRQAGVPLKRHNTFRKGRVATVPARRLDVSDLRPVAYQ